MTLFDPGDSYDPKADEIRLRKVVEAANEARHLLRSPVLLAAFDTLADELLKKWKETKAEDGEVRERIWRQWGAVHDVREVLVRTEAAGGLAKAELDFQEQARQNEVTRPTPRGPVSGRRNE